MFGSGGSGLNELYKAMHVKIKRNFYVRSVISFPSFSSF